MSRSSIVGAFALLFFVGLAAPAQAQVGFGSTVAADDVEVLVGEPGNNISPGIVYVYRPDAEGNWVEVAQLTRSDATDGDGFGASLVREGDLLIVGATDATEEHSGAVYVFRREADGWTEIGSFAAEDAAEDDDFGGAVDASGELVIVGASGQSDDEGAAYIFARDAESGGWRQVARLEGDGAARAAEAAAQAEAEGEEPGAAGREIEAEQADPDAEQEAEVVAEEDAEQIEAVAEAGPAAKGEAGGQDAAEQAEGERQEDGEGEQEEPRPERFGAAVAIDGDWALVGAPGQRSFGGDEPPGSVYVFHRADEGWQRVAKLPDDGGAPDDSFGARIVLRGDEALIAATGANGGHGAVHVYRLGTDDWQEAGEEAQVREWTRTATLFPFDAVAEGRGGARFGAAILAADDHLLVGAPGAAGGEGRVYRVTRGADGEWASVTKIAGPATEHHAGFGDSLARAGRTLVAGMPGDDFGAGSAAILEPTAEGWSHTKVFSEVRGLDPVAGSPIRCENGKAGLFDCHNVDLLSFLPIQHMGGPRGIQVNDIWGWQDPETGKEYALVGMMDRTAFVDVTDPQNPVFVGVLPKTEGSRSSIWRDIKVHADHAFVVSDSAGEHGVQIFDLRQLRRFEGEPITFEEDAHYDRIHSAHNIVIDTDSAYAFVVGASGGGETCGGGLHMINIEDPRNPVFEGCFQDTRTGRRGTGYSHDAQCVIYQGPDENYRGREICFGANETALSIADVTDKRNPVTVAMATYPNVGYTHQGWLSEDHRFVFMNDEGDEAAGTVEGTRTLIFDVQELDDPILVGEYIHDVESMDHNLYVLGDKVYESNYNSGLRVLDITDPEEPELAGYFDSVPWGRNVVGEGGMGSWSNYPFLDSGAVAFTSGREGLFLVRLRETPAAAGDSDDSPDPR